jgi:ABC-type polar amino acid transport system ATPase subunit
MIDTTEQKRPAMGEKPIITLEGVTKYFGDFEALRGVSTDVSGGEVVCIVGPSGSGKSTLLRTINGLEPIDGGTIRVDGVKLPGSRADIRSVRQNVGMVFQSFNLFPHMTVRRNLTIAPIRSRKLTRTQADTLAVKWLSRVHIGEQIDKYPGQLSGGQQQRVAIARALAMEPRVLLFDEPTSALDAEMVHEVLDVIRELSDTGITMIIVTHELKFAREVADRIIFMAGGDICADAPPAEFFGAAENPRLASFLSKIL